MRRAIRSTGRQASREIADVVQASFVLELLGGPGRLWLVSPWITDVPVIDNRGGEFSTIAPGLPEIEVPLSLALKHLVERGLRAKVVTRDDPTNAPFLAAVGEHSTVLLDDSVHRKRLVSEHVVLWGSMNFTRSGVRANAEDVEFDVDPSSVANAISEMIELYGDV
jgi:hypothetical protein